LSYRLSARIKFAIGVEGFEPSVMVPKTTALPLGYTPESVIAHAGEEGIEPPPLSLKPRILAVELFPRFLSAPRLELGTDGLKGRHSTIELCARNYNGTL